MNDEELLVAARKFDQDALNAIFECYAATLYKYAMRLCADPAEADDIVGEVFNILLKHLSEGKGPRDNLRSYLYQIAYHKIVDNVRSRKHETTLEPSLASTELSLQKQQENAEQLKKLGYILKNDLTEDQQHVVILRFIEDLSLKETADVLGKDIGNIKVIQSRAISKIREALGRQSEDIS